MKQIFALLILFSGLVAGSQAATLKIATIAPDGTGWMNAMRQAAAEIKKETDGRVKIRYFPGGVQGSDKSVLRKMKIGQLQGGAVSAGALSHVSNMVQLYSLPFTFRNAKEMGSIRAEFDHYIESALKEKGYQVLGMTGGGFAYLMGNRPLRNTSDFQGLKVWAPEGDVVTQTVFKNAGIDPVVLPLSDVYTSLQTGLIDTVGVNMTASIALQWHTKLSHATDFPLLSLLGMLVVDERAFGKLSADDQATVKRIMSSAYASMDDQNLKDEESARKALESSGMNFVSLSDEDKATWRKLADTSMAQLADEDVYPTDIYQQLLDRLESLRATQP